MAELTKRQFLNLAGLAIADRIVPRRLLGAEPSEPGERKLILVTFGGGVRYAETFAPEGLRNIPRWLFRVSSGPASYRGRRSGSRWHG